jgi:hypothetical protein
MIFGGRPVWGLQRAPAQSMVSLLRFGLVPVARDYVGGEHVSGRRISIPCGPVWQPSPTFSHANVTFPHAARVSALAALCAPPQGLGYAACGGRMAPDTPASMIRSGRTRPALPVRASRACQRRSLPFRRCSYSGPNAASLPPSNMPSAHGPVRSVPLKSIPLNAGQPTGSGRFERPNACKHGWPTSRVVRELSLA